jgi:hypothetical protein
MLQAEILHTPSVYLQGCRHSRIINRLPIRASSMIQVMHVDLAAVKAAAADQECQRQTGRMDLAPHEHP